MPAHINPTSTNPKTDPLYQKITSFSNLLAAYYTVRRGKRAFPIQQEFELDLESNLIKIQRRLRNPSSFKPLPYKSFTINEPKTRQISAPAFEDRIIFQAIFRVLEPPIVKRCFIPTTYACIKGRGTHKAVYDIQRSLQVLEQSFGEDNPGEELFFLKADIRKYFSSIDHGVLKGMLRKLVPSSSVLTLLFKIIDSYEEDSGKALPLGNVTSQLFANLYLARLDAFLVGELGELKELEATNKNAKPSCNLLFRYMDDFLVLGRKADLLIIREKMQSFLENKLFLLLHPKKLYIQRVCFGIDFGGYRVFANKLIMRKSTVRRYICKYKGLVKCLADLRECLVSGFSLSNEIMFLFLGWIYFLVKDFMECSLCSHIGFLKHAFLQG